MRFTGFGQMHFLSDPGGAPLLAGMSQITRTESRDSEMVRGYSQMNANEQHHQSAGNFVPRPAARFLQQEPDGATQGSMDQRGRQAVPFPAVRPLRQKPSVQ